MKRLIIVVSVFVILMATDSHAVNIYIFDASGTMQKLERFFLSPSKCRIGDVKLAPISTGEFAKVYMDAKKSKYTVSCKVDRALDVKKEVSVRNKPVYIKLETHRYKRGTLEHVDALPKDFYEDYKEAK